MDRHAHRTTNILYELYLMLLVVWLKSNSNIYEYIYGSAFISYRRKEAMYE
jgi:hypothetical protein